MSDNETLRRMMAEGYPRWRPTEDDSNDTKLEKFYRNTWLCSACESRHPLGVSVCPCGGPERSN